MKKIVIVVDVQNGFTRYPNTENTAHEIDQLLKTDLFDIVIATKFENNDNSVYSRILGWERLKSKHDRELYGEIEKKASIVVRKNIYTCVNTDFIQKLSQLNEGRIPEQVFLMGIDTDCCVLKIATDLFELGIRPIVLTQYCNSNGGEQSHLAGLTCLRRFIGKQQIVDGTINTKVELDSILNKFVRD